VARVEGVIGTFRPLGKAADTPVLAQGVELPLAPGQEFVGIGLMAHVPDDLVLGGVEDIVQSNGELHHPEARGQMPAGLGHRGNDFFPDLPGHLVQKFRRQFL